MQTGLVPSTASLSHSLPTFLTTIVPHFKSTKSTVHSPLNGPDFIYKVYRPSTFNISIICTTNALQPRALQPVNLLCEYSAVGHWASICNTKQCQWLTCRMVLHSKSSSDERMTPSNNDFPMWMGSYISPAGIPRPHTTIDSEDYSWWSLSCNSKEI